MKLRNEGINNYIHFDMISCSFLSPSLHYARDISLNIYKYIVHSISMWALPTSKELRQYTIYHQLI